MNDYEDMLIDALDLVASQDLPDEMLTDLVFAQARLTAGFPHEDFIVHRDVDSLPF